jgi:hypothetical protein
VIFFSRKDAKEQRTPRISPGWVKRSYFCDHRDLFSRKDAKEQRTPRISLGWVKRRASQRYYIENIMRLG